MKKGEIYEGIIERVDFPNRGVVSLDGEKIIVKNGIPGQKIRFQICKKRSGRAEGRLLEVLEKSPQETREPVCSVFPACGGCMYQTMDYQAQLAMKERQVRDLLENALAGCGGNERPAEMGLDSANVQQKRVQTEAETLRNSVESTGNDVYGLEETAFAAGEIPMEESRKEALGLQEYPHTASFWEGIHGSPQEFAYRNKMEFSFGDAYKDGPLTLGLHKKGSTYDVLNADDCRLVHPDMNKVLVCVRNFFAERGASYYHRMQQTGYLRHLLLRRGTASGEILVNLVTTTQAEYDLSPLVDQLLALPLEGKIVGILHILNDSLSDVVQSDETRLLYGQDYFYETLLGLKFKITPFSFFQPNSRAAEILYSIVRDYVGDTKGQTVFDLYSGTGTIAQLAASVAREVIGVEIVEEAVEAARANAARNGLTNCRFIAGDVLKALDDLPEKPDTIILDPPRDGIHPKALPKILSYGVTHIVYISCKATSLARDLPSFLSAGYRVERACAVDQFCQTVHVECVVLMSRVSK